MNLGRRWGILAVLGAAMCGGGEVDEGDGSDTGSSTSEPTGGAVETCGNGAADPGELCHAVVGVGTRQFAAAIDVDLDGDLDVVTANADATAIAALLYDGAGGFVSGGESPVAGAIAGGFAVDLNGDAIAEVVTVVADGLSQSVQAYALAGGAFAPSGAALALTGSFVRAAAGDLDGDGDLDVVAQAAGLLVLRNDAGQLVPALVVDVPPDTAGLALADLGGDGLGDLITVDAAGVAVRSAVGDGTFAAPVVVALVGGGALAAGDLTGDGAADVAVQAAAPDIALLRNTAGVLGPLVAVQLEAGSDALGIADADDDDDGDVFASRRSSGGREGFTIFRNEGDAAFTRFDVDAPTGVGALSFADFNADGRLDALGANGWLLLSTK